MDNLVSIILPVYNGEDYIKKSIESVIAQTYPHWELVVVDASTDSTPDIVNSFNDDRIKYFRQKSKGSVNGYNEALDEYVIGEYVTFIHHDDVYSPSKLYEMLRTFEKFSDVDCVYNDIEFINTKNETLRIRKHEDFYHRTNDLLSVMFIGYGIQNLGMQVMVKREFIEKHKLRYSLEFPIVCDHEYIFQLIDKKANFKSINKILFKYLVHETNYSGDKEKVEIEDRKLYARYSPYFNEIVQKTNYSDTEKQILLARLFYRVRELEKAEDILKSLSTGWSYFYLGTGYYRYRQDYEKALEYLLLGLKKMPYRAEFLNNIGCCYYKLGDSKKAEEYFEKAKIADENLYIDFKNPQICDRESVNDTLTHNESFNKRWSYL
jgi:glycosyltransferase involved in cell wall biosynthesis